MIHRCWLKKNICTTWELWVKFYLGSNEDCSLGDNISANSEKLLWGGKGRSREIQEFCNIEQVIGNVKRLLLNKENQIFQVKEFSAFLCMGRCKSLGSLKSFLWYAPQLSGASIQCILLILSLLGVHMWEWGGWSVWWLDGGHSAPSWVSGGCSGWWWQLPLFTDMAGSILSPPRYPVMLPTMWPSDALKKVRVWREILTSPQRNKLHPTFCKVHYPWILSTYVRDWFLGRYLPNEMLQSTTASSERKVSEMSQWVCLPNKTIHNGKRKWSLNNDTVNCYIRYETSSWQLLALLSTTHIPPEM